MREHCLDLLFRKVLASLWFNEHPNSHNGRNISEKRNPSDVWYLTCPSCHKFLVLHTWYYISSMGVFYLSSELRQADSQRQGNTTFSMRPAWTASVDLWILSYMNWWMFDFDFPIMVFIMNKRCVRILRGVFCGVFCTDRNVNNRYFIQEIMRFAMYRIVWAKISICELKMLGFQREFLISCVEYNCHYGLGEMTSKCMSQNRCIHFWEDHEYDSVCPEFLLWHDAIVQIVVLVHIWMKQKYSECSIQPVKPAY